VGFVVEFSGSCLLGTHLHVCMSLLLCYLLIFQCMLFGGRVPRLCGWNSVVMCHAAGLDGWLPERPLLLAVAVESRLSISLIP
jgi:hypothetical protein